MNKEEFIGKLEMVYVGDRNAFNEIVDVYDELKGDNKHLNDLLDGALKEYDRLNNIINELKWKPIEEYDKSNCDWVLVKYFDGDYECVPCVAEKRFGKWYSIDEKEIQFDVKYFMDMQQLDKLKALKENNKDV